MNEYTASNGIKIKVISDGQAEIVYPQDSSDSRTLVTWARPAEIAALREFFRAEADERLGRWRDPESPDRAVYKRGDRCILILDETDGDHWMVHFVDGGLHTEVGDAESTVVAWVAAHPEPKPWQDAKPGEVWMLVTTRHEEARAYGVEQEPDGLVFCPAFRADFKSLNVDGAGVKSAHRIYPPADPS